MSRSTRFTLTSAKLNCQTRSGSPRCYFSSKNPVNFRYFQLKIWYFIIHSYGLPQKLQDLVRFSHDGLFRVYRSRDRYLVTWQDILKHPWYGSDRTKCVCMHLYASERVCHQLHMFQNRKDHKYASKINCVATDRHRLPTRYPQLHTF